jgi:hypothetical protein
MSLSTAEEPKAPDLSELRDAVKAASKRGENVDEIRKALDALDKLLTKGWTAPKPGETIPAPVELAALREAVEAAAKKGENVEAISKELEVIEKAMTGKSFMRPKPLPPLPEQPRPQPQDPFNFPQVPGFPQNIPNFPQVVPFPGGAIDPEVIQKMQELQRKALEMMLKNPNDADAKKLLQEAQDLMLKAMPNNGLNLGLGFPNVGRMQDRFRLGIRMERLAPITADQLGLDGRGVAIVNVVPGSAAEKAGFKVHDIVLEFAGKPVSDDPGDLSRLVNDAKAGEKIDAVVMRKGKKTEIKGIELPEAAQFNPQLDIQPFPLPDPGFRPRPPRPDIKPMRPMLPNTLPDLGPKPGALPGGLGNIPVPARPNLQALPAFPNPFNAIPNAPGNVIEQNSVSITMTNGQFTLNALQDGVKYMITGTAGEKEPVVEKITITVGDKTTTVTKLDDVPKEHRPAVEKLLKSIR